MMVSIFQSISVPRTWLRWVKWRGWWQTKSKLKGCLMKQGEKKARSWTVTDLLGACVLSFTTWSVPVACHGTDPVLQTSVVPLRASLGTRPVRRFFFFPQSIDHDTEVLKSSVNADALWCGVCCSTICFKSWSRSACAHVTSWMPVNRSLSWQQ